MAKITKIDVSKPLIKPKIKVAAYARVSMDTDRLRHSLSTQISYYNNLIQNNSEWQYVGVYADLGISGTSIEKRTEFKRMIEDCEQGKIDVILTKSIQRFARNTVDLLEVVRHLKTLGIEVRFEKENINSLSSDGELMLSILASFAQEESRSISENVKWGIRKRFEKGLHNGRFQIYGYRWIDQELVIEPKESKIVKRIYKNYLSGISAEEMEKEFQVEGVKGLKGNLMKSSAIRNILKNITYTGNLLFQKEYVIDPISGKSKLNYGELPQYFVENHHEAIIPMEVWQQVQDERARRRKLGAMGNPHIQTSALTSKIKCSYCNRSFQHSSRKLKNGRTTFWECATRKSGKGNPCGTGEIRDDILYEMLGGILKCEVTQEVIREKLDFITVSDGNKLEFHLLSGEVFYREYVSNKRIESWTEERRKQASENRRNKHKYNRTRKATPFTGLIECGCCSNSFTALKSKLQDGAEVCYLRCKTNRTDCPPNSIKEHQLKEIIRKELNLDAFDEGIMDEKIERIIIANQIVRLNFKDGTIKKIAYQKEKKKGHKWTKKQHEVMAKKIKESWTEERRKKASEQMKKMRSEKKWQER